MLLATSQRIISSSASGCQIFQVPGKIHFSIWGREKSGASLGCRANLPSLGINVLGHADETGKANRNGDVQGC